MNALLQPAAQKAFAEKMGYLPTVTNGEISPELESLIGFSEAEQNRLWQPDLDFIMENQATMLDTWNRVLKG